jgi:hypothetical protein
VAGVLRAFRRLLRDYLHPKQRGHSLAAQLGRARRDGYTRKNKASRDYARKKQPDPPAGPPQILTATAAQVRNAQEFRKSA